MLSYKGRHRCTAQRQCFLMSYTGNSSGGKQFFALDNLIVLHILHSVRKFQKMISYPIKLLHKRHAHDILGLRNPIFEKSTEKATHALAKIWPTVSADITKFSKVISLAWGSVSHLGILRSWKFGRKAMTSSGGVPTCESFSPLELWLRFQGDFELIELEQVIRRNKWVNEPLYFWDETHRIGSSFIKSYFHKLTCFLI